MSEFDELDGYIGSGMSLSYWADEGIDVAAKMIERFGADDWAAVESAWRERPADWQQRCAQILEYADPARSVPLLLTMLEHGDDDLAQEAAYTLDMPLLETLDVGATPAVRLRLEKLADDRPGDAETDRVLLARLRFGA